MTSAAFPDLQVIIEDDIAEGAKVVQRATMVSIIKGEIQGVLPVRK